MANNHSTASKIKAKLAFHDVSDANALQQFTAVVQGLKGNLAYTNPPVDLVTYEKGVDSFATLLTDAQDGGKNAVSAKNRQRVAVIRMYTLLGHYVEIACNDDPATLYQWFYRSYPYQDCVAAAGRCELPMDRSRSE